MLLHKLVLFYIKTSTLSEPIEDEEFSDISIIEYKCVLLLNMTGSNIINLTVI